MHRRFILSALVVALAALPARAADEKKADALDKKVTDIVKQAGDLYKNAKSFHTEMAVVTDAEVGGEKKSVKVAATYDVERPNHFALKTRLDGDANGGPDVVSDGKKLAIHAKSRKQYTEEEVADLPTIGMQLLQLGTQNTGVLFQNILGEDPYEALMDGVTACSYAGKEKVNGTETHHLKFEQPGMNWELWVAVEGKPFVLKAKSVRESDNGKATTVETYKNWKIDATPAKDAFSFAPGEQSKKVKEFSTDQ